MGNTTEAANDQIEVVVGVIGRAHGLRGDVAIDLRTDEPERRFADGATLYNEANGTPFTVASSKWHGGRLLVKFDQLVDRTAVENARGVVLMSRVDAAETPEDEEEFYDRQLVGLEARSGGERVGTVASVIHLAAQDLLSISTDAGERLVPFVSELVPVVNVREGYLEIADVPGLLVDEPTTDTPTADGSGMEADS